MLVASLWFQDLVAQEVQPKYVFILLVASLARQQVISNEQTEQWTRQVFRALMVAARRVSGGVCRHI